VRRALQTLCVCLCTGYTTCKGLSKGPGGVATMGAFASGPWWGDYLSVAFVFSINHGNNPK